MLSCSLNCHHVGALFDRYPNFYIAARCRIVVLKKLNTHFCEENMIMRLRIDSIRNNRIRIAKHCYKLTGDEKNENH